MSNAPEPLASTAPPTLEHATLAGGCFWCLEAVFLEVPGVIAVEPGYSNGQHPAPTYHLVCEGDTGHAEVVRLSFDPRQVGFEQLLAVFFHVHDPTTLNRQGHDVGTQYRSGIYTHSESQAQTARQMIGELQAALGPGTPVVTEVAPVSNYHTAEAEHHRYFERHPYQGYCAMVVAPKVERFRLAAQTLLKGPGA